MDSNGYDINDYENDLEYQSDVNFDREYYVAAICDKYGCADDVDVDEYFAAVDRAIDKTLEVYTNGKLMVEDWDMFDQELDTNVFNELSNLVDGIKEE